MGSRKNRSRREPRCSARGGDLGMRWGCGDIMGGILLVGCSPKELSPLLHHPLPTTPPTTASPFPAPSQLPGTTAVIFQAIPEHMNSPVRKKEKGLSHLRAAEMNIFLGFWCPGHPSVQPAIRPPGLPWWQGRSDPPQKKLLVIPGFSKTQQPSDRFR